MKDYDPKKLGLSPLEVVVNGNFEKAFKQFNGIVQKDGVLKKYKQKSRFESKSEKRKRKRKENEILKMKNEQLREKVEKENSIFSAFED